MKGAIVVRPARPEDAEEVARLLDELGYPTPATEIPLRLRRIGKDGREQVFVAERGERLIGLATVHVASVINRVRDVAWLTALVVEGAARRSGVGRRLVEEVERFAKDHDCERLTVTTYEGAAEARAFYPKLGFSQTGVRFGKML